MLAVNIQNVKYIQIPHFAVYSFRRIGYLGCIKNEKQKLYNMAQLTDIVREKYNMNGPSLDLSSLIQ